jgi:hypothetical protein
VVRGGGARRRREAEARGGGARRFSAPRHAPAKAAGLRFFRLGSVLDSFIHHSFAALSKQSPESSMASHHQHGGLRALRTHGHLSMPTWDGPCHDRACSSTGSQLATLNESLCVLRPGTSPYSHPSRTFSKTSLQVRN